MPRPPFRHTSPHDTAWFLGINPSLPPLPQRQPKTTKRPSPETPPSRYIYTKHETLVIISNSPSQPPPLGLPILYLAWFPSSDSPRLLAHPTSLLSHSQMASTPLARGSDACRHLCDQRCRRPPPPQLHTVMAPRRRNRLCGLECHHLLFPC